jgi:hypothetical protein
MLKLFAYVQFALAALCFVLFGLLAIAHPSPHGLLPTVTAALIAPLPVALPLCFGGWIFLCIHGYLHSLREDERPIEYQGPWEAENTERVWRKRHPRE